MTHPGDDTPGARPARGHGAGPSAPTLPGLGHGTSQAAPGLFTAGTPVPEGNSLRGWVKLLVVKSTDGEGGRKGCGRGGGRGWRLSAPSAAWLVPGLCFACKQVVKSSLTQAPTCGGRRTHWNTGSALAGGASEAWPLPPPGAAAETQQHGQPAAGATRLATERRSGSWGAHPFLRKRRSRSTFCSQGEPSAGPVAFLSAPGSLVPKLHFLSGWGGH